MPTVVNRGTTAVRVSLVGDDLASTSAYAHRDGVPGTQARSTDRARRRRHPAATIDAIAIRLQCVAEVPEVVGRVSQFTLRRHRGIEVAAVMARKVGWRGHADRG